MIEPIEHFVREILGCTCPPAVFARVENGALPNTDARHPVRRIAVGGRLLIYLVDLHGENLANAQIPTWVRAGLSERNRLGMNRFRLVLSVDDPDQVATFANDLFERLPNLDDKAHLHLVARSDLDLITPATGNS